MAANSSLDSVSERFFVVMCVVATILIRWSVGTGPYSGMRTPPLYGDYEAQRHWQEITINTPIKEWYRNTSDNDLLYWGLDYPPLTAYHSWAIGKIAYFVNPDWVALHSSRGTEGYYHKLFMRYTVLFADVFLFFPALYLASKGQKQSSSRETYLVGLLYPGLILIDCGHFQYNNVSLGLFLLAVHFLKRDRVLISSVLYCLALNYKQMELYHSISFFCFLLGKSLRKGFFSSAIKVGKLGITVIATFAMCWLPFLSSLEDVLAVVSRIFPVNRGLYEDKVANFWCAISPVIKLKDIISSDNAVHLCIIATLLTSLPSALHLLRRPTIKSFSFSCVAISLSFFLFSYQVHEKSILIPAVSACLVYAEAPFLVTWFLHISTFSMAPLLLRDGLVLQFFMTRFLFMLLTYGFELESIIPSADFTRILRSVSCGLIHQGVARKLLKIVAFCSIAVAEILTMLLVFVKPPDRFPDLWPVTISAFSCFHFLGFFALFVTMQLCRSSPAVDSAKKLS